MPVKSSSVRHPKVRRRRDPLATKRDFIEAVGTILARDGFSRLGVNAVARQADADKALIYRYFGSFEELLEAYAEGTTFWPTVAEMAGGPLDALAAVPLVDRVQRLVHHYVQALRSRPLTQEILAWELADRNEITVQLEKVRERRSLELLSVLHADLAAGVDLAAVSAIFAAAVHYLLLRARKIRWFNGIDIRAEEGWARLEAAARAMLLGALSA